MKLELCLDQLPQPSQHDHYHAGQRRQGPSRIRRRERRAAARHAASSKDEQATSNEELVNEDKVIILTETEQVAVEDIEHSKVIAVELENESAPVDVITAEANTAVNTISNLHAVSDEFCSDKTFGDAVDGFEDKVENENRALTASDLIEFLKKSEEKRRKERAEDLEK